MFFTNLLIYRLSADSTLLPDNLEAALAQKPAIPCGSQVTSTYGFVPALGKPQDPFVHVVQGFMLIAGQEEERILPGSVVRDALREKVVEIETADSRKVYKKEKDQLKDEIVQALLPRAFIRRTVTFAAIDSSTGLIFVNASSTKRAEELLSAVREVLGSLPVRPQH